MDDERHAPEEAGGDAGAAGAGEGETRLAARLGDLLARRGLVLATAESCTGGLVAGAVTAVPGSSRWFGTGFVTYANRSKERWLGVRGTTLEREGAVSEAVVREMARGARSRAEADVAVAVSGVAGPDGGSDAKPVGTVWLAWALPDGRVETALHRFPGGREAVRAAAVREALHGTIGRLLTLPTGPS